MDFLEDAKGGVLKMKMHKLIDQLLMDGKDEEAVLLIEEVWRKEKAKEAKEKKKIADLRRLINQQLEVLAKRNI